MRFEAFLKAKYYFKAPRLSALPHLSSIVRPALAQASLGGRLGAAFLLMQCVCGAVGAGGWVQAAASPSVLTDKYLQAKNQSL